MDEAIHIMRDWSFSLFSLKEADGLAIGGFPYVGPLPDDTGYPQTQLLILGRDSPLSPSPALRVPMASAGLWSDADDGFYARPLEGSDPIPHMDRIARATPSPHVRGRVVALAHFLAAFKDAFLLPGQSRGDITASFSRVQHLLPALLFDWHPYQHAEDPLALTRFIRQVEARLA